MSGLLMSLINLEVIQNKAIKSKKRHPIVKKVV